MAQIQDDAAFSEGKNPWGNASVGKYSKVFSQFGVLPINDEMKRTFSDFHLLRNGLCLGQRDFGTILDAIKEKKEFNIVTGFSPSGPFHFGHKAIIDSYVYFRKYAKRGYFIISDVDAYVSRPDSKVASLKQADEYAINNIANAIALGVPEKDIILQSKQPTKFFIFSHEISKKLTLNTMKATLGHDSLGKFSAAYLQISDILFPQIKDSPAPTLIPVGIEQDPIIRLARDVASRFSKIYKFDPIATLYLSHVPSLKSVDMKMSKGVAGSGISLMESKKDVEYLLQRAFTGGRNTVAEQRKFGANPDLCTVCILYRFINKDPKEVEAVLDKEHNGQQLCGDMKVIVTELVNKFLAEHQEKYEKALDAAINIVNSKSKNY